MEKFKDIFTQTSKQEDKLSKKDIKKLKLFEAIPQENQGGDCYEQALHYFQRDTGSTLVHGLVNGQGALEGILYNHAWCEKGSKIIDMTLPKDVQKSLDINLYYAIGGIQTTYKYNRKEAMEKLNEYETYGPWEDKLISNKY